MNPLLRPGWSVLLLMLLFCTSIRAQCSFRERLPLEIAKEKNDTNKIKLMVRYVMLYGSTAENKTLYDEIKSLSIKNNYRPGLIYLRFDEGMRLSGSGRYDEAIAMVKSCIVGLDSLNVIQPMAYPLYSIRFIYELACKRLEMFRFYIEKLAYYKKFGPIENTAACYHSLGKYYLSLTDYDKAIGYFIQAMKVFETFDTLGALNDRASIGSAYLGWGNLEKAEESMRIFANEIIHINELSNSNAFDVLGDLSFLKKDYKQALRYYYKGKGYYIASYFRASNMASIAQVYLQLGAYDSALFYLREADKIRQAARSDIYFINNYPDIDFTWYKYYSATGDKKRALQHLLSGLKEFQNRKNVGLIQKYLNELHLYYLTRKDSLQAFRYLAEYFVIQDSLKKINTQAHIATFEIEQQQQTNETEIEHLQVQKKEQRNDYLIGGAFSLLIVIVVISLILYSRKRNKEQLTSDFKSQLAHAETKALRSQMNPHFIFNSLNSINNFVTDEKHEIASEYLLKFSKLIRLILDNSRCETIPLDKELETLQLYVQLESARFDERFRYIVNIDENIMAGSIMIPPMLLQPFIENAIWHGLMHKRAKGAITVDIGKADERFLTVSITDDGIGREKAAEFKSKTATHRSHGLQVTSERIELMNKLNSTGAKVQIIDLKDDQGNALGTRVELTIPI